MMGSAGGPGRGSPVSLWMNEFMISILSIISN